MIYEHTLDEYIDLLSNLIDNYNYTDDFSDYLELFNIIPNLMETTEIRKRDRINAFEKLKEIREKIKTLICKKPGNISKTNPNYLLLKK